MKTEHLIQKLCLDLSPIKRIYPAIITFWGWIIFSSLTSFLFVWSKTENLKNIHIPEHSYELIPIILITLSSTYTAIRFSIPGNRINKKFYSLAISFLIIWALSLIIRYLVSNLSPNDNILKYHTCAKDIFIMSLPSTVILIYIINRRLPIQKGWTGFWILSASASIAAIGVSFLCFNENPSHLFFIHFFPVLALSLFGIILGTFLFREV